MKKITSQRNPLIRFYLKLLQGKGRRHNRGQRVAVEGFNLLEEAVNHGFLVEALMYCPEVSSSKYVEKILRSLPEETEVMEITPSLLHKITNTESPQGVVGMVVYPDYALEDVVAASPPYWLLLDRLQDPGNMGTIIRAAAGAGFAAVICTPGTVHPFNAKVVRSTAGSLFHLKVGRTEEPHSFLDELNNRGVQIVSTVMQSDRPYYRMDFTRPSVLLVGNERNGVSPELTEKAHYCINVPTEESVESLNAAVAAGVVMFEVRRQSR